MALTHPPISNSCIPITKTWSNFLSVPLTPDINVAFLFHSFLSCVTRSKFLSLIFFSLNLALPSPGATIFSIWQVHFFCCLALGRVFWHALCDLHVSLNPRETSLNLQDRFWFVHITYGSLLKLQFLAQFPVDPHPHRVMPTFFYRLLHLLIM